MLVTFHEVEIYIEAETPREAYEKLTKILADDDVEYDTSTYSTDENGIVKNAMELWELGDI